MPVIVVSMLESLVAHDHVWKTSLDLSQTIEIKDLGRHIQVRDACQRDGKTYLVGGATSLHSSALGMDAFLFVYEANQLIQVESYGGMREDIFTQIHCGESIVVAGHSTSADFLDVSVHHFHRAFVLELDSAYNIKRKIVVEDPFESTIHGLDVHNGLIVAVGQVQRITQSQFLALIINQNQVSEHVFGGDGFDVFYDVLIENHIIAVGRTSSNEYGVSGPRAIQMHLNHQGQIISRTPLLSSSESQYRYIDSEFLTGASGGVGFIQQRGSTTIQMIAKSTIIEGRFGSTWFGQHGVKGFIEGRSDTAHTIVQAFDNLVILQKTGMLYEVDMIIPHLLVFKDDEYFYNNQPIIRSSESFWEDHLFIEQEVGYPGPFKVIFSRKTTRRIPTCNVQSVVYYHPVTVVCNVPFTLNGLEYQDAVNVNQPGFYHLEMEETSMTFEIQPSLAPRIEVQLESQQVISVVEQESRLWMIPASMFVLFVGKKYLG